MTNKINENAAGTAMQPINISLKRCSVTHQYSCRRHISSGTCNPFSKMSVALESGMQTDSRGDWHGKRSDRMTGRRGRSWTPMYQHDSIYTSPRMGGQTGG